MVSNLILIFYFRIDLAQTINRDDNLLSNNIDLSRRLRRSRKSIESPQKLQKKLKKRRLVFLDDSPNYCRRNSTAGFPGIIGRTVSSEPGSGLASSGKTREEFKNFRKICVHECGFKIQREILDVWTSCNCRFHWCCKVECETCRKKSVELKCVP